MSEVPRFGSPFSILSLRETRQYIRRSHAVMMTVAFAVIYGLGSMVVGGMLIFAPSTQSTEVFVIWGNGLGTSFWNYPGLLVLAPWGIVDLPFFATVSMLVVSIGVAIGMSIAVLLAVALVRTRRASNGRPAAVGSIAGLTPAMIGLVTLGACCSTTLAATAGVGIVAQVSGSSADNLLTNNWFLGVFQIAVVWVALIAQELVLRVYGGLLGIAGAREHSAHAAPKIDRRYLAGTMLRVLLLVGGVTWSLGMLVEWTTTGPLNAPAALWVRWLLEHQVPAFLAILAALFPRGLSAAFRSATARGGVGLAAQGLLLVGGLLLLVGAPPPLSGWGLEGLVNELMGVLGLPAAWGAVVPVFPFGLSLLFRWGLQYVLLGAFAVGLALAPGRFLAPLSWTVAREAGAYDRAGSATQPAETGRPSLTSTALEGPDAPPEPTPSSTVGAVAGGR